MSSTRELIKKAVKNAEITDYIMLIRDECMIVILVEDFIKDIVFGGELVCDTLLGCWKTMGQFDGGTNPENGDDDPCDCDEDFVKIHFPKGEGIKIITEETQANVSDSVYILKNDADKFQLIVVDEEGNKRNLIPTNPVTINIASSDSSIEVSSQPDGGIDLKAKVVDGENINPQGFNIFKELKDKKLQFLPIEGLNLAVQYLYDVGGNITGLQIGNPDSFAFKTFYVNEDYPTYDGDGSLSKPYKTFDACYDEYVSPLEDNPTRPGEKYNRAYPKNAGARIILLSDVTTSINPTINNLIFDTSSNSYVFTYTGSEEYMFDTELIYPIISKTGVNINETITIKILGTGTFKRTDDINRGLVRCYGSIRNPSNPASLVSNIILGDINSNFIFEEAAPVLSGKPSIDINLYKDGVLTSLQSIYGGEFKATTSSLYIPNINKSLFDIRYRNPTVNSTILQRGKCTIKSFSQTSIYAKDAILSLENDITFVGLNEYISYNGVEEIVGGVVNPVGTTWIRYLPHTNKNIMQLENTILICKGFRMDERSGFLHYGWDSGLFMDKTSEINELLFKFFSQHYFNSFVKLTNDSFLTSLGTGGNGSISELFVPNAKYLISGGVNSINSSIFCIAINTTILAFSDLKPVSNLSNIVFETNGTLLGLKGKPVISGIDYYPNATIAGNSGVSINGLFKDASKSGAINSL